MHSDILQLSRNVKCLNGMQTVLLMKRDRARKCVKEAVGALEMAIRKWKHLSEERIDSVLKLKNEQLENQRCGIGDHIRTTASLCNRIEELLKVGEEMNLLMEGPDIVKQMESIEGYIMDPSFKQLGYFEFVPCLDGVLELLDETHNLGYVQCTAIEPNSMTLSSPSRPIQCICGVEEIFHFDLGDIPVVQGDLQYIILSVENPDGIRTELELHWKAHTSYIARYTPEMAGLHLLHIAVYDCPSENSPMEIFVSEPFVENSDGEGKGGVSESCRKAHILNQQFVKVIQRYISRNPPVRPETSPPACRGRPVQRRSFPKCHMDSDQYSHVSCVKGYSEYSPPKEMPPEHYTLDGKADASESPVLMEKLKRNVEESDLRGHSSPHIAAVGVVDGNNNQDVANRMKSATTALQEEPMDRDQPSAFEQIKSSDTWVKEKSMIAADNIHAVGQNYSSVKPAGGSSDGIVTEDECDIIFSPTKVKDPLQLLRLQTPSHVPAAREKCSLNMKAFKTVGKEVMHKGER